MPLALRLIARNAVSTGGGTDERAAFVSDDEQRDEGYAERKKHRQLQNQQVCNETLLERPWPELPHYPHHVVGPATPFG
ncbi:hypothetical protein IB276_25040 [Ensifer sp. ENS04]|uniref:hypothetical protein n=1 Tax=Ensifer sp. ENS04 TaxID=2769281 RepID=UPI00177ACDCE|nr:hypothetical protein [Ensifer sp. ENS04]MBD9542721.1 hypothetical protein [Ensifer sp. ENS04]